MGELLILEVELYAVESRWDYFMFPACRVRYLKPAPLQGAKFFYLYYLQKRAFDVYK